MVKIGESKVKLFINAESENFSGQTAANKNYLLKGKNNPQILLDSAERQKILFLDQGKTTRLNLDSKYYLKSNATGGAAKLTAASTPQQLLKDPRVRALLDVIGYSEGTGKNYGRVVFGRVVGPSDRNAAYNHALVGKTNVVVSDFRHHPNLAVRWADGQPTSSAAGRYQFLYSTYQGLKMPDFTPHSQDLAAIKLMQGRGMIEPLLNGDLATAIHQGAPEWASLPTVGGGSYYGGQGAKNLSDLRRVYSAALHRYQGTTPPSNPPTPVPTKPQSGSEVLAIGRHGSRVETLQNNLVRLGVMTSAQKKTGPGIFGPRTEHAVKTFQNFAGLTSSGRFDEPTRTVMNRIFSGDLTKGAENSTVLLLQKKLVHLNYLTQKRFDTGRGIFGPQTDAALRSFQRVHQITADGIFGPKTFRSLLTASPRKNTVPPPKPSGGGQTYHYKNRGIYSTGSSPARQVDGYEDLQPHHDYQSVNYVMRGLSLNHRLEARDVVLTKNGESNFGQSVPAPLAGKVLFAGDENDGYGNKVVIKNQKTGQIVMLGHLDSISIKRGAAVVYGEKIGGQGSSGHSTGAHVHINADPSVIKRWVADLADGVFDGARHRFDIGRRP